MMGLTRKQAECLAILRGYINEHGVAPSMMELGLELGRGQSNVNRTLLALEERGYIRRIPRRARAIELIEQGEPITLSPQVERAVSEYARRTNTSTQAAANELLSEYLAKVAA